MKNPTLIKEINTKISNRLNDAGFKCSNMAISPELFESQKEFVELCLVYDSGIYEYLVQNNLIHFDFCLLCGGSISKHSRMQYTFFGRYYYLCQECYSHEVPESKKIDFSQKKEGCYIATMVYKDYNHPQVITLRNFRDRKLMPSVFGRKFINFYYSISPKIVKKTNKYPITHIFFRSILNVFIKFIK